MNGAEFAKKCMHEAGVAIVPGTAFGKTSTDYVRFSFAASSDNISQALEKIKKFSREKSYKFNISIKIKFLTRLT